jgi:hypothetical protein
MLVKDLIDQLINLPLDCELDIITSGPDPARPLGRELAQHMYFGGWMLENSGKGEHRRACIVLKTNSRVVPFTEIVHDYEDGTIQLATLQRTEDDPALSRGSSYYGDYFQDTSTQLKRYVELQRRNAEGSQLDNNEFWQNFTKGKIK